MPRKNTTVMVKAEPLDAAIARMHARKCKLELVAVKRVEVRGMNDRAVSYVGKAGRGLVAKTAVWRDGKFV